MPPTGPRQLAGSAHIMAPPGRATTRSGAATAIRISCSIMWAVNRRSPSQCSGETKASARPADPEAGHLPGPHAAPDPGAPPEAQTPMR